MYDKKTQKAIKEIVTNPGMICFLVSCVCIIIYQCWRCMCQKAKKDEEENSSELQRPGSKSTNPILFENAVSGLDTIMKKLKYTNTKNDGKSNNKDSNTKNSHDENARKRKENRDTVYNQSEPLLSNKFSNDIIKNSTIGNSDHVVIRIPEENEQISETASNN